MPRIVLASALTRWLSPGAVDAPGEVALECEGERLDAVLESLFARHPNLRGYVLDERGAVRHHVAIFIDGDAIRDKARLHQAVRPQGEVYVMQALSGG
jgi:molybdopterin synthase sulfur carrier subunit